MSQTQPRPSDASSIQDTQAAWMTETQNRAAAKSSSRDASWSSTTAPATNNVNKTSGSSGEPAPAQHSPTIALDHSLPSHDSSGPESLLVDALKGIPDVTRDDIAQSQDTYPSLHGDQMPPPDASFSQLPHVPQSTAPQIHRHQGSQVLQLSAPSSDAPQDPSDDGGSRSMELTEMRSGKPKDPSRPSNNSHKSEISSSQRNSQSQSLPDDTQVCGSPELPPMAESTRNSRPQYGRTYTISSPHDRAADLPPAQSRTSSENLLEEMRDADTQYASDVVGKTMAGHLFSQSSSEADESLRSVRAEVSEPRFFIKSHSPTIEKVEKNTDMDSARQNPAAPSVEPSSVTTIPDSDPDGPLAHMQPAENDVDGTFQQSSPQQGQITSTPRIGSSAHFSAPPMPPDQPQPGETDRINRNAEADSDLSDVEVPPGTAACQQGVGSGLGSSTSRSVIFEVKAFEHTDSSASHSENTGEESNPQPAARSGKGTSLEIGQASALSDDGSNERSSRSRRGRSVLKRKVTKISVEVTPRTKKARVVSPRKPAPYTLDEDRSSCIASSSAMHLDSLQSGDEDSEPTQPSSQQERRDCGELVTPRVPSLPVNRVFAYHASAKSYFPAEIISLSKHRAQCLCDDGEIIWPMFKDMRICHLKVGDPVVYVGMDESQTTQESVAPPSLHYVYRVEWADKSGRVVPAETELGPSMIVAACEATDSQKKSRFQVRAIKIPVSQNSGTLNDRKLDATQLASLRAAGSAADPEGVLFGARPSSKERSSHGSRRSTSVPDTTGSPRFKREISSRSRSPRVESNLFEGYGFFLTGFVKDDEQPSVSTTQNPIEVRRSMPESEVRDLILRNGGSVLGEVSDIADVSINNEGKPTLKFAKSLESLRHILMVANEPRRGSFKYLMSLALGLPCISTMWLEQCTDHDILQPLGPAFIGSGLSFHYGTHVFGRQATLVVEQDLSFQGVLKRQAHFQLFSGKQILHVTTSSTKSPAIDAATSLLAALGASVVKRATDKDRNLLRKAEAADYVLLEDGAKAKGVTSVVNMKWLKECIVSGQLWEPEVYKWD